MNLDQILSLTRAILAIVGTVLTTHGSMSQQTWELYAGPILAIVPIVWSLYHHSEGQQLKKAVAVMDKATDEIQNKLNETKAPETPVPAVNPAPPTPSSPTGVQDNAPKGGG